MSSPTSIRPVQGAALLWFRRDLRLHDNMALAAARAAATQVWCVFVFDTEILQPLLDPTNPLASAQDRRVEFIWHSLAELDAALRAEGGGLIVRHARAADELPRLADALGVDAVYANHDYEPAALARDAAVAQALASTGRHLRTFKDQVVFERDDILTGAGKFFSVFTPYKNAWLKRLAAEGGDAHLGPAPSNDAARGRNARFAPPPAAAVLPAVPGSSDVRPLDAPQPSLAVLGFAATNLLALKVQPGYQGGAAAFEDFVARMDRYAAARDFPAVRGVSYLSVHLRFGTVSLRGLVREAYARMLRGDRGAEVWLSELIWREFYFQVLHHVPEVAAGRAFKPEYDRIAWVTGAQADEHFAAWCAGRTGYPLVDAAMAQINQTGYMHNRLRMVVASFLVKDLGLDWRRGEAYFAAKLNDFDLSANNGGWQWAASSGCDAQPYFRIFNPVSQSEKFDADGKFIRRYLPTLAALPNAALHAPWEHPIEVETVGVQLGRDYPGPVVDHAAARAATLARYAVVKKS